MNEDATVGQGRFYLVIRVIHKLESTELIKSKNTGCSMNGRSSEQQTKTHARDFHFQLPFNQLTLG